MRDANKRYGPWVGLIIDRKYRLISPLGQGGMAMVFLAERLHLRDMVAIKILQPRASSDEDVRRRFQVEAAAAAKVKHPNVVTIYDFGFTEDGVVYIVMELLEGPGLDQEMHRSGRMSIARTLEIIKPVCSAIGAAHSLGLLHRDIKPPNIILHRGRYDISEVVKVVDFGIAKFFDSTDMMVRTSEGIVLGTAEYMSPEQCQGLTLDARSDVYSLAMVCYQMLSGKLPYSAGSTAEFLIKHVKEPAIPLRNNLRELPNELEAVIMQSLEKNPQLRPPSAMDFIRRLELAASNAQAHQIRSALNTSGSNTVMATPVPGIPKPSALVGERAPVMPVAPAEMANGQKSGYVSPKFNSFIARESELTRLNEMWQQACAGEGRPILLIGEPGIGKTRLLEEFCRRVEETGAFVFQGRFYRTPGVRSFHIVIGDLKKFFSRLQSDPNELNALFGARADTIMGHLNHIWQTGNLIEQSSVNDPETRLRYFTALSQAFSMLSRRRPVLLVLDDLHWADDSARELFDYLARSLNREQLMILASARPVGEQESFKSWLKSSQREYEMLSLTSFNKQQVFELLESIFGRVVLNESQFATLMAESGGNPYFLVELLRLLISEDRLKFDNQRWVCQEIKNPLPRTLADLVELTLEQLPESARQIFEIASVIGDEFDLDLLHQLANNEEDDFDTAIQRGMEFSLIGTIPNDDNVPVCYRFTNAVVRRVLYENMNKRARRRIHRSIAKWLAANRATAINELAHHYFEAAEWLLAFQHAVAAADAACEAFQIGELHKYLTWAEKSLLGLEPLRAQEQQALSSNTAEWLNDETRSNLERLATYRWLCGFNLVARGRGAQSEAFLQQARKLAESLGNQRLLGNIFLTLGLECAGNGVKNDAIDFYKQALNLFRGTDYLDGQSLALRHLSMIYEQRGDYTLALDFARAALEMAQAAGNRKLESFALSSEAWMLCKLRRFEESALVAKRSLALARKVADQAARCAAYNSIAQFYSDQGLYQEALHPRREALRIARALGNRRIELILCDNLGEIYFYLGKYQEAETYFLKVLKLMEAGSNQYLEQCTLHNLIRVCIKLNKLPQSRAYLSRVESLAATVDMLEMRCELRAVASELLLAEGKFRESIMEADQAITYARTLGSLEYEWLPWLIKTRALLSLDRHKQAREASAKCISAIEKAAEAIAENVTREKYLAYPERQLAYQLRAQLSSNSAS